MTAAIERLTTLSVIAPIVVLLSAQARAESDEAAAAEADRELVLGPGSQENDGARS